jgi:hypothetical protein
MYSWIGECEFSIAGSLQRTIAGLDMELRLFNWNGGMIGTRL